jgi:hypothetical protein
MIVPPLAGVAALASDPTLTWPGFSGTPPEPQQPNITGTTTINATNLIATSSWNSTDAATNAAIIAFDLNTSLAGNSSGTRGSLIIPAAGAGTVYDVNPIGSVTSTNFDLEINGALQAPTNQEDANWGGNAALFTFNSIKNGEITGTGSIDGQGGLGTNSWWTGTNGNPISTRPKIFTFSNGGTVLVSGLTLYNSPEEFITFGGSHPNAFTFNNLTISAPSTSPNTDGIDPDGSDFLISNSNISTGDDDIAIKAVSGGAEAQYIAITNMTVGYGHGISLGTGLTAGVANIYVNNVNFTNTSFGFRMKTQPSNGTLVSNVNFNNVTMSNVLYPVYISSWYNNLGGFSYPTNANNPTSPNNFGSAVTTFNSSTTPMWQNISFNNLTSSWTSTTIAGYQGSLAGLLYGLPANTGGTNTGVILGVTFNNVSLSAYQGMSLAYAGTSSSPIAFIGNWAVNAATGQQFGTVTNPDNANVGGSNPGNLRYWNGSSTLPFDGISYPLGAGGSANFNTWETSNVVYLTASAVPEPTTAALAVAGSALMLMRRRRKQQTDADSA